MNTLILMAIYYIIGIPILMGIFFFIQKKLVVDKAYERNERRKPRNKKPESSMPVPISRRFNELLSFGMKDKRSFSFSKKPGTGSLKNRMVYAILWTIGLAVALYTGVQFSIIGLASCTLIFFFTIGLIVVKSRPVVEQRKMIQDKLFDVMKSIMGYDKNDKSRGAIKVLEWTDFIHPSKVQLKIPLSFNEGNEQVALMKFKQFFSDGGKDWIAPETATGGWDYSGKNPTVVFESVPPLPTKATWDDHYLLSPGIARSFFPVGIGVKGGIKLENPATKEIESVHGFDVSGLQADSDIPGSKSIPGSPQALYAGGTGGGKALSKETKVVRFVED